MLLFEKKFVGGICLGSPTIITFLPLAIVPTASHTVIWEASSKTTKSKELKCAGKNWETESGDIIKHGVRWSRFSPISLINCLIGLWLLFLLNSLERTPYSAGDCGEFGSGVPEATIEEIYSAVVFATNSSRSLNSSIKFSCCDVLKVLKASERSIRIGANQAHTALVVWWTVSSPLISRPSKHVITLWRPLLLATFLASSQLHQAFIFGSKAITSSQEWINSAIVLSAGTSPPRVMKASILFLNSV